MRTCPDCSTELTSIKIVDQLGHRQTQVGLSFTVEKEPQTSAWTGRLTNETGTVQAYLCADCGRVLLYASPSVQ